MRLARDNKGNEKSLYSYVGNKMLNKENLGPLLNGTGNLETEMQ